MPLDRRPIILTPEISDFATILNVPNALEDYPVTNAFSDHPSDVWKPGVSGANSIDLDLGTNTLIDTFYLGYYYGNITGVSGFRIKSYTDATFTTTVYDSNDILFPNIVDADLTEETRKSFILYNFDGLGDARRYWRITVASVGSPGAKNWYIGRLILGKAIIFERNIDWGWNVKWEQTVDGDRSFSGSLFTTHKHRYRSFEMEFSYVSESDAFDDFYLLDMRRGLHRPVLICIDPEQSQFISRRMIYGPIKELTPIENQYLDYYKKRLLIHEIEGL